MEQKEIHITYSQFGSVEEMNAEDRELVSASIEAMGGAYAPYSHFNVGAAVLLEDGTIVTGSNQENAAYPSGLCAERTALFHAGSQYPDKAITTLAIAASNSEGFTELPVTPCGACRQVLLEAEMRCKRPIRVLMYGTAFVYEILGTKDLLPLSFTDKSMD